MDILLLVGLIAVGIPAGILVNHRRSAHQPHAIHQQFYSDGLMTQEIEALKIESNPPDQEG